MIYFFCVETQGRSLETVDAWFSRNPQWLVHKADYSAETPSTTMNGYSLTKLNTAEDDAEMSQAFAVAADDDDEGSLRSESPITRRGSYAMVD